MKALNCEIVKVWTCDSIKFSSVAIVKVWKCETDIDEMPNLTFKRDREFFPFSLRPRDEIENIVILISEFDTRSKISVIQSRDSRQDREFSIKKNHCAMLWAVSPEVGWKWK